MSYDELGIFGRLRKVPHPYGHPYAHWADSAHSACRAHLLHNLPLARSTTAAPSQCSKSFSAGGRAAAPPPRSPPRCKPFQPTTHLPAYRQLTYLPAFNLLTRGRAGEALLPLLRDQPAQAHHAHPRLPRRVVLARRQPFRPAPVPLPQLAAPVRLDRRHRLAGRGRAPVSAHAPLKRGFVVSLVAFLCLSVEPRSPHRLCVCRAR